MGHLLPHRSQPCGLERLDSACGVSGGDDAGVFPREDARFEIEGEGPWHQEVHELGLNYRLTDVGAALGLSQLRRLERFVARRAEIKARYDTLLSSVEGVSVPVQRADVVVTPDVDALFESVVGAFDEPFADSSAIPTFLVSELARRSVTVALSGDGGDELFAGYTRYADLLRRSHRLPGPVGAGLATLARRLPHRVWGRNRMLELSRGTHGRYAGMVAHPLAPADGGVALPEVVAAGETLDTLLDRWFRMVPERDLLSQASFVDLLSYLPGDILTKVDRMSMAYPLP